MYVLYVSYVLYVLYVLYALLILIVSNIIVSNIILTYECFWCYILIQFFAQRFFLFFYLTAKKIFESMFRRSCIYHMNCFFCMYYMYCMNERCSQGGLQCGLLIFVRRIQRQSNRGPACIMFIVCIAGRFYLKELYVWYVFLLLLFSWFLSFSQFVICFSFLSCFIYKLSIICFCFLCNFIH